MIDFTYKHTHAGKILKGTYKVSGRPKIIRVITDFGKKAAALGDMQPLTLARMLARELLQKHLLEERKATEKAVLAKHAIRLRSQLPEMVMPNGKKLKDCTARDIARLFKS